MPLAEASLETVETRLSEIDATLAGLCKSKNASVNWDVKYSMVTRGSRTIKNDDGSFTTALNFADPRNVLIVSDDRILPTRNWKIDLEWVRCA